MILDGRNTCGGRFGSLGFEDIDAKTYAEWGIDYLSASLGNHIITPNVETSNLEYDNCFNAGQSGSQELSYARYVGRIQSNGSMCT